MVLSIVLGSSTCKEILKKLQLRFVEAQKDEQPDELE